MNEVPSQTDSGSADVWTLRNAPSEDTEDISEVPSVTRGVAFEASPEALGRGCHCQLHAEVMSMIQFTRREILRLQESAELEHEHARHEEHNCQLWLHNQYLRLQWGFIITAGEMMKVYERVQALEEDEFIQSLLR